jgi:probable HAF family extracellular repeat protein
VVGYFETATLQNHAFITGANGEGMTDLGTLGAVYSAADDINAAGQVVGVLGVSTGGTYYDHAFITGPNGVGMSELGGNGSSSATGINDSGQVVGVADTATGLVHAFITGPNGVGMTHLGTLGGKFSFATGINAAGQVVGYADTTAGQYHAFITGPNGMGMTDLNSLVVGLPAGVILTEARAINNSGQVIAFAEVPVIPEPQIYVLMLAGLVLTGVMAQRKQKS